MTMKNGSKKDNAKTAKKKDLALRKETVRILGHRELSQVVGGSEGMPESGSTWVCGAKHV
jgi:hypothetical protein